MNVVEKDPYQCMHCHDKKCTPIKKACGNCKHTMLPGLRCINCKWANLMKERYANVCEATAKDLMYYALESMYRRYLYLRNGDEVESSYTWIVWRAQSFIFKRRQRSCLIRVNDKARNSVLHQLGWDLRQKVVTIDKDIRNINNIMDTFYHTIPYMLSIPKGVCNKKKDK